MKYSGKVINMIVLPNLHADTPENRLIWAHMQLALAFQGQCLDKIEDRAGFTRALNKICAELSAMQAKS